MLQVTITRTGLSLPDLVITSDPGGAYWLDEDGNAEPDITWRYNYAPQSGDLHGLALLSAVKDQSSLPLGIYVKGTTAADLKTKKEALTAAVEQWSYTTEFLVDGQGYTWSCDPTSPKWSQDSGMAASNLARATVVIPVYPIGA